MDKNTHLSITIPNIFLLGTFSELLNSSLITTEWTDYNTEEKSLFDNQSYLSSYEKYDLNQAYICCNYGLSENQNFYDSIVNEPINREILTNLILEAHSVIMSHGLLEGSDESDIKIENYFDAIQNDKAKKIIFRNRNC